MHKSSIFYFSVLAKSYARIGWQNLVNFGILPLEFTDSSVYKNIEQNDLLVFDNLREQVKEGEVTVLNKTKNARYRLTHRLSKRQQKVLLEGGVIRLFVKGANT